MIDDTPAIPPATEILCQQCTAVLPVEQGARLAICEFCGTSNAVDKSQVVLHYVVRATLRDTEAAAALRRWMGGNDTVKNLDTKASITSSAFELWPMWLVRAQVKGAEKVLLKPAAALPVLDSTYMSIPASDLEPYSYSSDVLEPTVPLNAVKKWLEADQAITAAMIKEVSLVHLPMYVFEYAFEGRSYTAVVDAAAGKVFTDVYPSKQEVPYQTVGGLGCLLYFCAALIPLFLLSEGGGAGLIMGAFVYLIAVAVISVPLFIAATYISAKV